MNKTSKQGFTIIEVVLVLAIAGLIFLMVFVALPSLQKSQRDTQRKEDVSKVASAITQYNTNTGNFPVPPVATTTSSWTATYSNANFDSNCVDCLASDTSNTARNKAACFFVKNYLNEPDATSSNFKSPTDQIYTIKFYSKVASGSKTNTMDTIKIIYKARCSNADDSTEDLIVTSSSGYAVTTALESGGNYCIDSGQKE